MDFRPETERAQIKAELELLLERIDALELHHAAAFVSMAVHLLSERGPPPRHQPRRGHH